MKRLTVHEVEFLAHSLARELMDWDEPIPDFQNRYPGKLESCLGAPFQTFDARYLYSGLSMKASALFYYMIKSHPFENGNKRIAVTTLLTFLFINSKWLKVDQTVLYEFAKGVANSNPKDKDSEIIEIDSFIREYMVTPSRFKRIMGLIP